MQKHPWLSVSKEEQEAALRTHLDVETLNQVVKRAERQRTGGRKETARDKYRKDSARPDSYFSSAALAEETPTGVAYEGNILDFHYTVTPSFDLHKWQAEELLRLSGYLDPQDESSKFDYNPDNPLKYNLCACNGAGKDEVILARFAVWLALSSYKSRVIITTASQTQMLNQTSPHISSLVKATNQAFGKCFQSVKLHHFCELTGSEILMFVTDEQGRAEGYHPWGGKMALVVNEGKSVSEEIYSALYRCTGYSYFINTSSPAGRTGQFYLNSVNAVQHPKRTIPEKYYFRRIPASLCPHIAKTHIADMIEKMPEHWVKSSIYAEFSDVEDLQIVIPQHIWEDLLRDQPKETGSDIGIGLDIGAGVAATACYVRKGNGIIHKFSFVSKDTLKTVREIDRQLSRFKKLNYKFDADDNGYGQAVVDILVKQYGWRIRRRRNQQNAINKRLYLNFGAESYYHLSSLVNHKLIRPNTYANSKLSNQITRRRALDRGLGKRSLEKKKDAAARGIQDLDEADAFVLCYWSYREKLRGSRGGGPKNSGVSMKELEEQMAWGGLVPGVNRRRSSSSRPTILTSKLK